MLSKFTRSIYGLLTIYVNDIWQIRSKMLSRATVIVVALLAGALVGQLQAAECPISPATEQVNFRGVAAACGTNSADETADPCAGCLCSLLTAFSPALTGTTAPGTIVQACVTAYITPITAAGVNIFDLTGVQSCPLTPADVQQCLGQGNTTALATPLGNTTAATSRGVSPSPGIRPSPSPAIANNTLRINPGSIEITPTGPTFTVSGTVTNPATLLKLMLNNTELVSTLDPSELTLLRTLYGQLSQVQPTPRVQRAFASIVDLTQPISAVELMTKVQDLLGSLADEGLLAPQATADANGTSGLNDTSSINGTSTSLNSSGSDTVIIQRPTSPLESPEAGTSVGRLNPVRSATSSAANVDVTVVASVGGLILAGLFAL